MNSIKNNWLYNENSVHNHWIVLWKIFQRKRAETMLESVNGVYLPYQQVITKLGKFQFVIKLCLKYFGNFLLKLSLSDDSLQSKLLKCEKSRLKSVEVRRKRSSLLSRIAQLCCLWTQNGTAEDYDLRNLHSQFITIRRGDSWVDGNAGASKPGINKKSNTRLVVEFAKSTQAKRYANFGFSLH